MIRGGQGRTDREAEEAALTAFLAFAGIAALLGIAWVWGAL